MAKRKENAVMERILIITIKDFQQPKSENDFPDFFRFCELQGLVYEKSSEWHVKLDTKQDIPQIKEDSFQEVEHHFKCMDPAQPDCVKYVFRITRNRIIFNFLKADSPQDETWEYAVQKFAPLWKSFVNNFSLPTQCNVSLGYLINLNRDTLCKDKSLFRENWLEVKEISSLFGRVDEFPFTSQYNHPFSCHQNWMAEFPDLGKVLLTCKTQSYFKNNNISLHFFLEVEIDSQCSYVETFDWKKLFVLISDLRNVILELKARLATEDDWK